MDELFLAFRLALVNGALANVSESVTYIDRRYLP